MGPSDRPAWPRFRCSEPLSQRTADRAGRSPRCETRPGRPAVERYRSPSTRLGRGEEGRYNIRPVRTAVRRSLGARDGTDQVAMETRRMRVTFRVTPQDTLTDSIDLYEWRNDDWVFMRAASVTPVPLLHEAELAHLLREGKHDEIESHRYPEPSSAVLAYVDAGLKG